LYLLDFLTPLKDGLSVIVSLGVQLICSSCTPVIGSLWFLLWGKIERMTKSESDTMIVKCTKNSQTISALQTGEQKVSAAEQLHISGCTINQDFGLKQFRNLRKEQ